MTGDRSSVIVEAKQDRKFVVIFHVQKIKDDILFHEIQRSGFMIPKRNSFFFGAVFILALLCLGAQTSQAAFVDVGLGARPVGLGRAFVALADDANAMLYNPAGLASLERMELTSTYARLFPGIEDDKLHVGYLGFIRPVRRVGTLGIGITNLWADLYGENIIYFSYGRSIREDLDLGVNLKLLRWSAEGYSDAETGQSEGGMSWSGFALDAGIIYALKSERLMGLLRADGLQLGLVLTNLNRPSVAENGADDAKLPLGIEGGLAYWRDNVKLLLSWDHHNGRSLLHLGQETELWSQPSRMGAASLFIRAGALAMLSEGDGGELDFGCGFSLRKALIDYAYVYPLALRDVGGCHKISFGYQF
jgi:hypothetical protein